MVPTFSRLQKRSVFLIQIGNFLEHFDLMLYVHMGVVINQFFFPPTTAENQKILTILAFCSTYFFRPIGALFFGYLGDTVGRKSTVVLSTMMMAVSCLVIASMPSYNDIGITAFIVLLLCRILQGFSSVGEGMGSRIYVAEITRPPYTHYYVSMLEFFSSMGNMAALGIGGLFLSWNKVYGWRIAFYCGAIIGVMGSLARIQLKESHEIFQSKNRQKKKMKELLTFNRVQTWNLFCYLAMECLTPLCFFIAFIFLADVLKGMGLSPEDIIVHNLYVTVVDVMCVYAMARASLYYDPMKILKARGWILLVFVSLLPLFMMFATSPIHIFFVQAVIAGLGWGGLPAHGVLIKSFPIVGRYTKTSLIFSFAKMLVYPVTSFGAYFVARVWGYTGIAGILAIVIVLFLWGAHNFILCDED